MAAVSFKKKQGKRRYQNIKANHASAFQSKIRKKHQYRSLWLFIIRIREQFDSDSTICNNNIMFIFTYCFKCSLYMNKPPLRYEPREKPQNAQLKEHCFPTSSWGWYDHVDIRSITNRKTFTLQWIKVSASIRIEKGSELRLESAIAS